jgi:PhoPQ-activated pathogenicity-related protein
VSAADPSSVPSHPAAPRLPRRQFAVGGLAAATLSLAGRSAGAKGNAAVAEAEPPAEAKRGDAPRATGPLADYAHAADPATRFEPVSHGELPGGTWRTFRLVSQRWRGVEWTHELSLYVPAAVVAARGAGDGPMLLWIDGGSSQKLPAADAGPSDAVKSAAKAADAAGLPVAVIRQVPYQPMFGGLMEDGLIAHSFVEYVKTGDPTWPLLLPMVKAAVAAMDAAVEIARTEWKLDVDGFVVTGASKRGWTSWLTTAIDPRVVGVVPQVIDMLSMDRHLRLQTQSFGGLSDKLTDYTSRGIEKLLGTPRGRELIGIVDPFSYRDRLTAPKLISLGTNDPYWPLESLDLYRGDLPGPCWVSYCPNAGHGIPMQRWAGLVIAMGKHVSGDEPLPDVRWRFAPGGDGVACVLHAAPRPERVVLWETESATRDFRQSKWLPAALAGDGPEWEVPLGAGMAEGGGRWKAAVVEVHYARNPIPLVLTTSVHMQERKG